MVTGQKKWVAIDALELKSSEMRVNINMQREVNIVRLRDSSPTGCNSFRKIQFSLFPIETPNLQNLALP